ncbi:MAG: hypothetical protein NC412_07195 [Roseburia sp.]|nr:hypothetical protein [Roseburia sp.]MCM1277657.1 hypothetical protein [Robinsoniella sp.]
MDKEENFDEEMIKDIMNHLDQETAQGTVRMSVNMDPEENEEKTVSHECCRIYGKTASEVVNLLDAYTDLSAGEPDRKP